MRFAVVAALIVRSSESFREKVVLATVRFCHPAAGPLVQATLLTMLVAPLFFKSCMVTEPASTCHLTEEIVPLPMRLRKKPRHWA